jgi:hypothetical protein
MHGSEDIPQILTYSLSRIVGFYFGAGTTGAERQIALVFEIGTLPAIVAVCGDRAGVYGAWIP